MADEKRPIDANELLHNTVCLCGGFVDDPYATGYMDALDKVESVIREFPTVDAVEVVRCKDCKHRGYDSHCPMCFVEEIEYDDDGYTETDFIYHNNTTDDGFCDRGEREENEKV